MNPSTILHTFFQLTQTKVISDKRRQKTLFQCVDSLTHRAKLTLTSLGRNINKDTSYAKHQIKRVCRLLGNSHMHSDRIGIYSTVARCLMKNVQRPIIVIDWSPVQHVERQLLRASFPIGGRSLTIYEEIHPEKKLASPTVHKAFLDQLSTMLPKGCKPLIMADAGFKVPWFKELEKRGWDWLSRVRGNSYVKHNEQWHTCSNIFAIATHKPTDLGDIELTQKAEFQCRAILFRKRPKGRKSKGKNGAVRTCTMSLKHAKGAREPWFLVTNLVAEEWSPSRLVGLYKQRMQIEEAFRDIKSERYGLSLNHSGTRCNKRLEILMLIGMLSHLATILVGKSAYIKGYYKRFQANTILDRKVLSYFYLGREVLATSRLLFSPKDIGLAAQGLKAQAAAECR